MSMTTSTAGSLGDAPTAEALARFARGDARLSGLAPAEDVVAAFRSSEPTLTHAGPPIAFDAMCAPMVGALIGATLFEGWAPDAITAQERLRRGEIRLVPNHHTGAVAPMAGVISPSMMAVVVVNPAFGIRVATILNEGNVPNSLRCGAHDPAVLERLRWLNGPVATALAAALPPDLALRDLLAEAVLMGDELHQRNVAASALLLRALAPRLPVLGAGAADLVQYLTTSPQAGLNLAMATAKALLDPLAGIDGCGIVTAMSRNGVEFGIRVSGTGERWFTAPAPRPVGQYWPGYSEADANPDIGDSAIVETAGLGGFALAGAPALHPTVGCGGLRQAQALQAELREIVAGDSPFFLTSPADGLGTPFGIDVHRVAASNVTPLITTGIAHRQAGVGQVGIGLVRAPRACFAAAADALARMAAPVGGLA
jgi:hypothetical protein